MAKRIIGLIVSLWLLENVVRDKVIAFLGHKTATILGIIGVIYFGHALLKKKEVMKWLK